MGCLDHDPVNLRRLQSVDEYLATSGDYDDQGNLLVKNLQTNPIQDTPLSQLPLSLRF